MKDELAGGWLDQLKCAPFLWVSPKTRPRIGGTNSTKGETRKPPTKKNRPPPPKESDAPTGKRTLPPPPRAKKKKPTKTRRRRHPPQEVRENMGPNNDPPRKTNKHMKHRKSHPPPPPKKKRKKHAKHHTHTPSRSLGMFSLEAGGQHRGPPRLRVQLRRGRRQRLAFFLTWRFGWGCWGFFRGPGRLGCPAIGAFFFFPFTHFFCWEGFCRKTEHCWYQLILTSQIWRT